MPVVEFFGASARNSGNIAANPCRLVNLYREPVTGGGRSSAIIKSVPGLEPFSDFPGVFTRGLRVISGTLYAVGGGRLYGIATSGAPTDRGAIADDSETTINGNNGDVTVVAGGNYYLWDGATLSNPTAGAFSSFGSHTFIGGYTVLTEKDGRRFQWSGLANASSLPGLNFSTADGTDANLVRAEAINGALYLFTHTSHEAWYVTGGAGAAAFERQTGGVNDIGLKSHNLISKIPGSAFFVGSDNKAYLVAGGLQPVSTPPIEPAIRHCSPKNCFTYEVEGHVFCVITFRDCAAWVYDVSLGEWHERAEGAMLLPWTATCSAKFGEDWYCGRDDAAIFRFSDIGTDNNGVLIREATSRTIYQDGKRSTANEFEIFPRQGFQIAGIELELSRDGGVTWTPPKPRSVGPVGHYDQRVIWRGLGQSRSLTARVRFSAPQGFTALAEGRLA